MFLSELIIIRESELLFSDRQDHDNAVMAFCNAISPRMWLAQIHFEPDGMGALHFVDISKA